MSRQRNERFGATTAILSTMLLAAPIVLAGIGVARADTFTMYAVTVNPVNDWGAESNAEGEPDPECSSSACCARNLIEGSEVYLEGATFRPEFVIPEGQKIVRVVVSALTRYDEDSTNCRVRLRVRSVANPAFPETTSPIYSWNQGNNQDCRWVNFAGAGGWDITSLLPTWDAWSASHFRVALRRYPANDPVGDTACRVNAFRVVVTTDWIVPPVCSLSTEYLDFGDVAPGTSRDLPFTIANTGGGILEGRVTESCDAFSIVSNGGNYSLAAGASRTVVLRFSPPDAECYSCEVDLGTDLCVPIEADGCGDDSSCEVEPDFIDFGSVAVGTSRDLTFSVTNAGSSTISGALSETSPVFSLIASYGTTYNLAPGASKVFGVRFSPTSPGDYDVTIDTGLACADVECWGVAVAAGSPICRVEPADLEFGSTPIGTSRTLSFTLSNAGGGTLTGNVQWDEFWGPCEGFTITSGQGPYALQAGQSRQVTVRFAPITDDYYYCEALAGDESCYVTCDGEGLDEGACCETSTDWLEFDAVDIGAHQDLSFTLHNLCDTAQSGVLASDTPQFQVLSGAGPFTLAPQEAKTVVIRFAPDAYGLFEGLIEHGLSCDPVNVDGVGGGPGLGACCFDDETCELIDSYNCAWGGGEWRGSGTSCGGSTCDQASGVYPDDGGDLEDAILFMNPYAAGADIWLSLRDPVRATVDIIDLSGARVARLHSGVLAQGRHRFYWNGQAEQGRRMPSGLFFMRADLGDRQLVRKIVLLR